MRILKVSNTRGQIRSQVHSLRGFRVQSGGVWQRCCYCGHHLKVLNAFNFMQYNTWQCAVTGFLLSFGLRKFWLPWSILRGADVEGVAEAVAEEVEGEEGEGHCGGGVDQEPRVFFHHFGAFLDENAPGTLRRLDSQSEET